MAKSSSSSSSKPKRDVADYRLSVHFGVCVGPVDAVTGIFVKEKLAWSGLVSTMTTLEIDQQNLFGGGTKEGGVQGKVVIMPGAADQVLPDDLANKLEAGKTGANMPAFRGTLTVFFRGVT